jgi:hypothetical protein
MHLFCCLSMCFNVFLQYMLSFSSSMSSVSACFDTPHEMSKSMLFHADQVEFKQKFPKNQHIFWVVVVSY